MASVAEILSAAALLRSATVHTEDLVPGDVIVFRRPEPGQMSCTITTVGTIVSAGDIDPSNQVWPQPHRWEVVVSTEDAPDLRIQGSAKGTWWRAHLVVADATFVAAVSRTRRARCPECGRVFDLTDEADADEFYNGHDCEE